MEFAMKFVAAALVVAFAGTAVNAQTATLQNGSFEQLCGFCGGPFPEGWHSPGNNVNAKRRFVGDSDSPALFPVGTPGALTPRTGNAVLTLTTPGNGGFVGITTDTINFCYCDQTCQTACSGPYPFFDPVFDYNGGDVVVTAYYMIPADAPINDQSGIKINIKVNNQDVATADIGTGGVPAVTGTTNGEWVQYTAVFARSDIQAHYECNTGVRPDCGCVCVPTSPLPNHAKLTPLRFVGDGTPTSGVIFWDDISFTQLPPNTCPGNACGDQDFNGDGDFGTDQDIEAFFACLGGNCCATCFCQGSDFNGDGDFGTDQDIESFFRVLAGGNC
jgi:hypothetical protein